MVAKLKRAPRKAVRGDRSVLEATQERIALLFDRYEHVCLSFSGGKDSTALFHLIRAEAKRRGRKFLLFFLDQEAEYQSTIDLVEWAMQCPEVVPLWYQVEIAMTNATSQKDLFLNAWGEGEDWIREKHPLAIKKIEGDYPKRFYPFIYWFEENLKKTYESVCSVVGLRAEESPDRKFMLYNGSEEHFWIYDFKKEASDKVYPIIDWSYTDIWKFLIEGGYKYCKAYDVMYQMGLELQHTRVSNLIHEKAYRCLQELQALEPDTYDKLEQRIGGIRGASKYAKDGIYLGARILPEAFKSWGEYKEALLAQKPEEMRELYTKKGEGDKHVVRRLLLNDWEGSLKEREKKEKSTPKDWLNLL